MTHKILKDGVYEIRFVPRHIHLPFVGGVYATGENINAPIRAEAHVPSLGVQQWRVEKVKGESEEDYFYTITAPGFTDTSLPESVGPVLAGFGRRTSFGMNEPVILSTDIKQWIIEPFAGQAKGDSVTYVISAATSRLGVHICVAEENSMLILKSFPILEHMAPFPHWQFIPVGAKEQ